MVGGFANKQNHEVTEAAAFDQLCPLGQHFSATYDVLAAREKTKPTVGTVQGHWIKKFRIFAPKP